MSIETSKNRSPVSTALEMASASDGATADTVYPSSANCRSSSGRTAASSTIRILFLATRSKILLGNHHVNADVSVDELGDVKIGGHRRRLIRLSLAQPFLFLEELDHLAHGGLRGDDERGVGAHGDPVGRRLATWPIELHVFAHDDLQASVQIGFDGGLIDFTVALRGMPVADLEQ